MLIYININLRNRLTIPFFVLKCKKSYIIFLTNKNICSIISVIVIITIKRYEMRNSKQRDTILEIVKESYDHPTVDMIYQRARNKINNISLGTGYRNLANKVLLKRLK